MRVGVPVDTDIRDAQRVLDGPHITIFLNGERIGQRFYRPAGQTGDGCGLGLAIVREIARQYQGTLSVGTSPRLGGALLKVEFPLADAGR